MSESLIWDALLRIPLPILRWSCHLASQLHYRLDQRHVLECQRMVECCENPNWNAKNIVRGMYQSLWKMPIDMARFGRLKDQDIDLLIEDLDLFMDDLKEIPEKQGVVFVAAHHGPWELCAQTISRLFRPTISIYKPTKRDWINRFFVAARHRHRQTTVPKDGGMLTLFKHLKRGGSVGLVIDQHGGTEGVESEFLGKPCSSWDSAVLLASKTKSPIIPVGLIRKGDGYRFLFRPAIEPPAPSKEKIDLSPWVKKVDASLSSMIEEAPEQWMWLGRRWGRDFEARMNKK